MSSEDEINSIVNRLEKLQLEQNKLIKRLKTLQEDKTSTKASVLTNQESKNSHEAQAKILFPIGLRVSIKNPNKNQESTGTVVKYNNTRVPSDIKVGIRTDSGIIIWRAPKNLRHYD